MFGLGLILDHRAGRRFRLEFIRRQESVRVLEGDDTHSCASCTITLHGDVGVMESIQGEKFYAAMGADGWYRELIAHLGVKTLEGYATEAHFRLLRIALRHMASVEIKHRGMMAGREMVWLVVKPKSKLVLV